MEQKTKIHAEDSKQELWINRKFDLPVDLVYKAYEDPNIFEQWMDTKIIKYEWKKHGVFQFATSHNGKVVFGANGVFLELEKNKTLTRTFEMENSDFPVQLEFLDFKNLSENISELTMHIVFKSSEYRNQLMKLPFEFGLNMAHNRLQQIASKLK